MGAPTAQLRVLLRGRNRLESERTFPVHTARMLDPRRNCNRSVRPYYESRSTDLTQISAFEVEFTPPQHVQCYFGARVLVNKLPAAANNTPIFVLSESAAFHFGRLPRVF